MAALLCGARRAARTWPGLRVEYAWRPPFEGESVTQPNRLEVVFSAHDAVELGHDGRVHRLRVEAGAGYVVGAEPTVLRRVGRVQRHAGDLSRPRAGARRRRRGGDRALRARADARAGRTAGFRRDPTLLGAAHRLRRAVVGRAELSDIEARSLAHLLVRRVLARQYRLPPLPPAPLDPRTLARVAEAVEARLGETLTLADLAAVAGLSPFHFARCFRAATGLAPHQYVLARRIELAKRLVVTTGEPVQDDRLERGLREPQPLPAPVRGADRRAAGGAAPATAGA